jgi:hypothetical protein
MKERVSLPKRIALALMAHACRVLPSTRSEWGEAMKHELEHIDGNWMALRWSAGCVVASYIERSHERPNSLAAVVSKPSAFLPMAMSFAALAMVLVSIGMFGVVHERDEGAVAHIWQLLMAGQMPILAFFILRWLPRAPKQTLFVFALQTGAALAAMAPVYYLKL